MKKEIMITLLAAACWSSDMGAMDRTTLEQKWQQLKVNFRNDPSNTLVDGFLKDLCSFGSLHRLEMDDKRYAQEIKKFSDEANAIPGLNDYIISSYRKERIDSSWMRKYDISISSQHSLLPELRYFQPASFSPDGSKIVILSDQGKATIWNAQTGILEHTLEPGYFKSFFVPDEGAKSAEFSTDGNKIVTGHVTVANVWNANTGALEHTLKPGSSVDVAFFTASRNEIKTICSDGTVTTWNATSGKLEKNFKIDQFSGVKKVTFSKDGSKILTILGSAAHIFNSDTGTLESTLNVSQKVSSAALSPNGTQVVTLDSDGSLAIYSVVGNREPKEIKLTKPKATSRVSFSANGKDIFTFIGTFVYIFDAETLARKSAVFPPVTDGRLNWMYWAILSPKEDMIVASAFRITVIQKMPVKNIEQLLFFEYLPNRRVAWKRGWGRTVMDTYSPEEKALIKQAFHTK